MVHIVGVDAIVGIGQGTVIVGDGSDGVVVVVTRHDEGER